MDMKTIWKPLLVLCVAVMLTALVAQPASAQDFPMCRNSHMKFSVPCVLPPLDNLTQEEYENPHHLDCPGPMDGPDIFGRTEDDMPILMGCGNPNP
jgi:hypothetical protein